MSEHDRFYGIYRGVCVNNEDPEGLNRITAIVPAVFTDPGVVSDWAWPMTPPGLGFSPPLPNSGVWIGFEGGDPQYPYWSGVWSNDLTVGLPYDPLGAAAAAEEASDPVGSASNALEAAETFTLSQLPWGTSTFWTPYTPTWTASVSDPAIGNGSIVGRYQMVGPKTCAARFSVTGGSTTSIGSGNYLFGLPVSTNPTNGDQVGTGFWESSGGLYAGVLIAANFAGNFWIPDAGSSLSNVLGSGNGPITLGVQLYVNIVYETA